MAAAGTPVDDRAGLAISSISRAAAPLAPAAAHADEPSNLPLSTTIGRARRGADARERRTDHARAIEAATTRGRQRDMLEREEKRATSAS